MEQIIWQIIMGILLLIMGFGIWCIQHTITKNEKKRRERDDDREYLQIKIIRFVCSNFLLAQAVAQTVKRGERNGELDDALSCSKIVKREVDEFLQEQGIKKII